MVYGYVIFSQLKIFINVICAHKKAITHNVLQQDEQRQRFFFFSKIHTQSSIILALTKLSKETKNKTTTGNKISAQR